MFTENIKLSKKGVTFADKHGRILNSQQAMKKITNRMSSWRMDMLLFTLNLVSLHVPIWPIRRAIMKLYGVKIGKGTTIHMGCKFFDPTGVEIGEDSKIGDRSFLDGRSKLKIGNHVDIASEVMIYNSQHDIDNGNKILVINIVL